MKKVLTIALFVTAAVLATSAQNLLPATVQQFLDDYQYCQRIAGESSASMMIETSPFFPARMIDGQEMVDVFIAYKSPGVISMLQSQGVFVNNVFDDFLTAQVPLERLAAISRLPGVEDVEVSRRMELATDSTMSATHALQVQQGLPGEWARGFDGSGVIVGVIDAGFDYNHRAFRRNDDVSKLRILRLYSTTDNSGHKATYNNGNYRLPDRCSWMMRSTASRPTTPLAVTAPIQPALPPVHMSMAMAAWHLEPISCYAPSAYLTAASRPLRWPIVSDTSTAMPTVWANHV